MQARYSLLFAFALLTAGCASVDTGEIAQEREYQTGSRLAKRQYAPPGARIYVPDASDTPNKPLPGPRGTGG
jgi:hypothetical protein